jgi:alpha-D-xyloside xylohydrolase
LISNSFVVLGFLFVPLAAAAQNPARVVLDRPGETIVLEPYAPNIVRVTLSLSKSHALAAPGYGILAHPDARGWTYSPDASAGTFRSARLNVSVTIPHSSSGSLSSHADIARYFNGSAPPAHITISTVSGAVLSNMRGWSMSIPNFKDGNASLLADRGPSDAAFHTVGASFLSPPDEHYYGLGQNQEGFLDLRGHAIRCWHDYNAPGGPSIGVPFLVTNKGYGLLWDNPSKTIIEPGFNDQTRWSSEVGDRVSYFLITGSTYDEIYSGYRLLTGPTPLLSKAAYGFIQSKQRYSTQAEVLAVADGYHSRSLPLGVLVLDWFYFSKMGDFDMVPANWPDPAAMNRRLHELGIESMISIWPRFTKDSCNYNFLLRNNWFLHRASGAPTDGLPYDRAGSDIDTTNPAAARWFWQIARDRFLAKGFDSLWADETEPDLPPNGSFFSIGPGTRFFNVYPLFHTAALYDGFRRDTSRRAVILARDAYLGAQRNGTMFWSSDIHPTWDTLRRQIPTGLNFAASGLAYWSNDIGGWQYLPAEHKPERPPLLDPSEVRSNVGGYDDYPELFTRWFEYGAFQPIFRTHGSRRYNEIWSYGAQAESILTKYLKLRYELLPYIYSLAWRTYQTGAPYMRGLFMDFPNDPQAADVRDEYMFGPAFLVAPVTVQGAVTRRVYLPAGSDWFNFWTNERFSGGRSIEVSAPIDILPLFVRAGSIVPLAKPVSSAAQRLEIAHLRVYLGADADFTLYDDDGKTYTYESGAGRATHLHWNNSTSHLTHEGPAPWPVPDESLLELISR